MAQKFLSNIELEAGLVDVNGNTGTSGQILSSTGSGVDWIPQSDIVIGEADKAKTVILRVKNSTASAMSKGQVICEAVSASPPSGNLIEVALADNDGTNTMPALGILNEDLDAAGGANDEGDAVMFGKVSGIDTSAFSVGDEVYVDSTPGGLTITKPTGVKYIQKVGVVIRDDATNGTIEVFGAGRVNDVPTPLYVNHLQQRLGVGVLQPNVRLDVSGNAFIGSLHSSTAIGQDATAIGQENEVSGFASFAGNQLNVASGAQSAAFNYSNTASGGASFATGSNNTVSGVGSFSNGNGNTVSGNYSGSFGASNTVSGNYGFNSGENNEVKGNWNAAFGFDNFVEGGTVTAVGCNAVLGRGNEINSQFSGYNIVGGLGNTLGVNASSNDPASANIVGGAYNTNYWAENCLMVGGSNTIGSASVQSNTGTGSIMGGYNNFNNGSYSIVSGYQNTNFSNAGLVLGLGSTGSTGDRQFAIGEGVTTPTSATAAYIANQFVVGRYNEYSGITTGHLFAVGNGNSNTDRSTAFCVLPSGNVGIDTNGPKSRLHVTDYTGGTGSLPAISSDTLILAERIPVSGVSANISVLSGISGTASISFGDSDAEKRGAVNYLNISDEMRFQTAAGDRVTIKSDGDVGIGTTDPGVKLDVIAGSNNGIRISSEATSNPWKDIKVLSYVSESQAASFSDGSHIFTTNPSGATTWPFTEYGALVIEGRDNNNGGIALRTGTGTGLVTRVAIREGGNVGIGTTDPIDKLQIDAPNSQLRLRDTDDGSYSQFSSSGNALAIRQNSTNANHIWLTSTGRVGIGTGNNPSSKLHVDGTGRFNQYVIAGNGSGGVALTNNDNYGNANVTFNHLLGTPEQNGQSARIVVNTDNTTTEAEMQFELSSSPVTSGTAVDLPVGLKLAHDYADITYRLRHLNDTDTYMQFDDDRIRFYAGGSLWLDSNLTYINGSGFANYIPKFTDADTITTSAIYDDSGDIGIGTTNPGAKTHIYGINHSGAFTDGCLVVQQSSTGDRMFIDGNDIDTADGDLYLNDYSQNAVILGGVLRVGNAGDSYFTGDLGIGTTSPDGKLDVAHAQTTGNAFTNPAIAVTSTTATDGGFLGMTFATSTAANYGYSIGAHRTSGAAGNFEINYHFNSAAGSTRFVIDTQGDVGIGTSNPSYKLDVAGTSRVQGTIHMYGAVRNYSGDFSLQNGVQDADILFKVNDGGTTTTPMMIDGANSRVGIGTTNPATILQLYSNNPVLTVTDAEGTYRYAGLALATNGGTWNLSNGDSTTAANSHLYITRNSAGTDNRFIFHRDNYYFGVYDNTNSIKAVIRGNGNSYFNGGNLGIGTTAPTAQLHVTGAAQGAKILSTQTVGLEVQGGGNSTDIAIFRDTSGNEEFSIDTNGALFSLGMASSSSANASLMHNATTGQIYRYTSSIRYKEDVTDLENAVDKIKELRPVNFKSKDTGEYNTGMIAEEVAEVMPEITYKADVEGFDTPQVDGITYEPLHAYYIKAIQELSSKIEQLESRIQTLENN